MATETKLNVKVEVTTEMDPGLRREVARFNSFGNAMLFIRALQTNPGSVKRTTRRKGGEQSPPLLPGMQGTLVFGGVQLTPMDTGKLWTGKVDLWSSYAADGMDGPGLFDSLRDTSEDQ